MLDDRARVEETVQDALVDAWRGLDQFDAERPLRPWLLRVLVNRVMQVRRRELFGLISFRETRFEIPATDLAPQVVAEREWARVAVRQALGRLEPDAARLVFLRYFAELSISEIAEVLAIPEGTVKSRLHRARGQLRGDFARRGILGEELR
jgi:RNA polymerase sigma-70 factor, ECF subfamily